MNVQRTFCEGCELLNKQNYITKEQVNLPLFLKDKPSKTIADKTISQIDKENLDILSRWHKQSFTDETISQIDKENLDILSRRNKQSLTDKIKNFFRFLKKVF